jgi:hypothetical protein
MLRQESPEEQGQGSALPAAHELSRDELSEVLNEAIARQAGTAPAAGAAQPVGDRATLAEAIEIARQVNVPEEHVLAAHAALQRRKEEAALVGRRDEKRDLVRQARQRAFMASAVGTAIAAGIAFALSLFGFTWAWGALVAMLLLTLYRAARWLASPVSDAEADSLQLAPVAGTCQVCGLPAHTPRSTLCEEHRFKGPGG